MFFHNDYLMWIRTLTRILLLLSCLLASGEDACSWNNYKFSARDFDAVEKIDSVEEFVYRIGVSEMRE